MKCYHYTSLENFQQIQEQGLIPYQIKKPELIPFFPDGICGVWLWLNDLSGEEHIGSVLWQLMTKGSTTIVKLRVECETLDLLHVKGMLATIDHDGRLGSWDYHRGATAIVATVPIPPTSIELIGTFNLIERLSLV